MTKARWEMIKSAYLDASPLPERERQLFLEELAVRDQELVLVVCDLLAEPADQGIDLRRPCWPAGPPNGGRLLESGSWLANRFEVRSCLGTGGVGEVYRAFDHDQREFIAVKVLRPEAVPDRAVQMMLRHELHTARLVTHTNVCRLHEFYAADADVLPFITMELVIGQTIQERLSLKGPFAVEEARPVVAQMLDGLEAAHAGKVIHRDFKAGNIMLSNGGRVVLMDFGLARDLCPGPDLATTISANRFAGTLAYMSPEQLQGQAATIASDIHALGVVLFEMLTGARPFDAASPLETASRRLNEDAPRPRFEGRLLDRSWEYVIQMCLARDPQKRPESVDAVRQVLSRGAPLLWRRRRLLFGSSVAIAACWGGATWQNDPSSLKPAQGTERSALDHYLRGSKLLEEFSLRSVGEAVVEFDSALARDAHYALAMSGSADAHLFLKNADPANAKHHLDAARRLALQAVQTDPSLAEGHNSLAAVRQAEWRWQDAEMSYREALRLKPGLAKAHRWFCGLTLQFGRTDEALVHARRAIELDPYDRALPATIGLYYFLAGNNKQALELLEPAVRELDIVGRSGSARFNLAQVYARMGYLASGVEARAHFTKAIEQATIMKSLEASGTAAPPSLAGQLFALIHSLRGEPGEAEPFFAPMLIEYARGNIPALHMAWVYAAQRKIDEAIAVLDRGLTVHDPTLLYIKVVPFLENLRHDQRFLTIVQRMNL